MRRIELEDIAMYYRMDGVGDPVLLLHGLGSSSEDWEYHLTVLAQKRKVVVPDLRGHGASSKPDAAYGVPLLTRDVIALVKRLGLSPLHVVGLSLGGMVAFQLAVDAPELTRSLVIVNSGPETKGLDGATEIQGRLTRLRLFGMRSMAEELSGKLLPKPEQAELRATFVERWSKNDPVAYERALRGMFGWSVRQRLGEIACPVLVVSGDRDYTTVESKASYVAELPNARLVTIQDSGHFTSADQPAKLASVLGQFLDEVTLATPGVPPARPSESGSTGLAGSQTP